MKQTALHDWHIAQNAKMVEFAGYSMPVSYPLGVMKEHLHTRDKAGLFDVSHMGQFSISNPNGNTAEVAKALEAIFPSNLIDLGVGRQVYSLLLNEQGGVVDDLMICRREHDFVLVVNAGCKEKDFAYIQGLLPSEFEVIELDDRAMLAVQRFISQAFQDNKGTSHEQALACDRHGNK